MPRSTRPLVRFAPLALAAFTASVGAHAAGGRADEAPDALMEAQADEPTAAPPDEDGRGTTTTPNQDALERFRWFALVDGFALVDRWSPDGVGQGVEVLGGASVLVDWMRVMVGLSTTRGPATPSYCTGCTGAPIAVHPSLQTLGLTLAMEGIVPFGPVRPFLGLRQAIALAAGEAAPYAPSVLLSLSPRAGVEIPLPASFAVRLSAGVQLDANRWIFGELPPLASPWTNRQSPEHLRFLLGVGLSKAF